MGAAVLVMVCGCGKKIADADLYNVQAAVPAGLPYPVMEWKAITTVVDRGAETTGTLFGNDAAVSAARAGMAYPAGAVLGLVTWRQREDPHWFGARIPGAVMSVEFVEVGTGKDRMFVGTPWREVAGTCEGGDSGDEGIGGAVVRIYKVEHTRHNAMLAGMNFSAMKFVLLAFLAAPAMAQRNGLIQRLDGRVVSASEAKAVASAELKADGVTGAQVAILNHGRLVWSYGYGLRDVAKNLPMTPDTNVWAASITKAVFATWVMRLVEEARLNLDEPVAKMLPKPLDEYERYKVSGTSLVKDPRWLIVTPRMLLAHTAGFANFRELEPDQKIHLHFTPGTRFAYSGEGLNMLQFVLEQTMGISVAEAMAEDIFKPLQMNQTGMVWQALFDENEGLRYGAKGNLIGGTHRTDAKAAGSMTTSARDLSVFLEALLANKILNAATKKEMLTQANCDSCDAPVSAVRRVNWKRWRGRGVGVCVGVGRVDAHPVWAGVLQGGAWRRRGELRDLL